MSDPRISALTAFSLLVSPAVASPDPEAKKAIHTPSSRTSGRHMLYRLSAAPMLEPKGTYVGKLQEKWQFPSDHLPIGMTMDGLNIASWNVLDASFMRWMTEKDSQGLKHSMIVDEHIYIGDS